ncbi:hypothetical protein ACSBM8_12235 [Sphingomonas sp. ASY06-1R]
MEERPILEDIHSNWRVTPNANGEEMHAIGNAVDLVRVQHPYIQG